MSAVPNLTTQATLPSFFSINVSDENDLIAINSILQSSELMHEISLKYSFLRTRFALLIAEGMYIYIFLNVYVKYT